MKRFILASLLIAVLLGCSSNKVNRNLPVEKKMQIADDFYTREKYHKAIPYYTAVVLDRNSSFTAEAQMKLANCYFYQNKFMDARFEYEELIRLFKNYQDIDRAYFRIGICYYENSMNPHYTQEETYKAIDAFQTFIEKFPFSNLRLQAYEYIEKCNYKILQKKYYNGYAYYKLFDYSAALMYFEEVIAQQLTDEIDKMSLYYSGRIYLTRDDKDNAFKIIEKMKEKYPESKETLKLEEIWDS